MKEELLSILRSCEFSYLQIYEILLELQKKLSVISCQTISVMPPIKMSKVNESIGLFGDKLRELEKGLKKTKDLILTIENNLRL